MKYFLLGLQKNRLSETKHTILIADDEPDILEILQYHLTAGGYMVHTVKDGDEALDAARRINPDLIILDMMMPKKNGIEVCELLKAQIKFKETPILFLTALNDEATHIKAPDQPRRVPRQYEPGKQRLRVAPHCRHSASAAPFLANHSGWLR